MWAVAKIQHLKTDADRLKIIRNLNRILDIRVVDVDVLGGKLFFRYKNSFAFEQAKLELYRIGYPMVTYTRSGEPNESTDQSYWT
ncbi:hypothetical protein HCG49_04145 [Arenibacter sp. 6A1]|uniref:hypothetical protein n=1 Tax=Arenibacter sp. 6A1 TaxID=2720391 RepID=UPI001445F880|nr:hypothetical protein [Arenibacter sp. 6A1]NKI25748.1 hypothetical protein [Arenibacter sp. 6A1]